MIFVENYSISQEILDKIRFLDINSPKTNNINAKASIKNTKTKIGSQQKFINKKSNDFMDKKTKIKKETVEPEKWLKHQEIDKEKIDTMFVTKVCREKTKQEEIIFNLKSLLNKITEKNHITIYEKINVILNENKEENLELILYDIFDNFINNKLFILSCVEIYKSLIKNHVLFETILESKLNDYYSIFNNIEYFDSNVDYDAYCKNNKKNEKRRNTTTFFCNIINKDKIEELTYGVLNNYILNNINNSLYIHIIDEVVENLAILILYVNNREKFENIIKTLIDQPFDGLSKKSKFKFMNIVGI
jgi:hypothetical protein